MSTSPPVEIDVLVVCQHDAEMVKRCLTSAKEGARSKVNLWVHINGGTPETGAVSDAVHSLPFMEAGNNTSLSRYNAGFIKPNNALARIGKAPYLCLLNADTICAPGWDVPLVEALTQKVQVWDEAASLTTLYTGAAPPDTPVVRHGIVGYGSALLGRDMVGIMTGTGGDIDYVEGWCLMTTRAVWESLGGFDEAHLTLAYGEDSDLCLRAREGGWGVAAVENKLPQEDHPRYMASYGHRVFHIGGQGATVETRRSPELQQAFAANHAYLRERHKEYLETGRVLVKGYKTPPTDLHGEHADDCLRRYPSAVDSGFITYYEVDGRLWQLEFAGQSVRFLVP